MSKSKNEIIIIDNYVDKQVLDIISRLKVRVILITKEITKYSKLTLLDIEKYNEEYNNLVIKYDNSFHDRYIIIDRKILYHLGASLKDLGKKTFSINEILDIDYIDLLLNKI